MTINFKALDPTAFPPKSKTFTAADLWRLTVELTDFPDQYPQLAVFIDRLCYELGQSVLPCCGADDCHCVESFDEFHAKTQAARASRQKRAIKNAGVYYALKTLAVGEYLRDAAAQFPRAQNACDRLCYELLIAVAGNADFWQKSFDEFARDCRRARQMGRAQGIG